MERLPVAGGVRLSDGARDALRRLYAVTDVLERASSPEQAFVLLISPRSRGADYATRWRSLGSERPCAAQSEAQSHDLA